VTTGYGDLYNGGTLATEYTSSFGGTSGASPMVTGTALCLQGMARALGGPLTPIALRELINSTGIPELGSQLIGPRPDLGAAAQALLLAVDAPVRVDERTLRPVATPNPFRSSTTIRFSAPAGKAAALTIFDVTGRAVRTGIEGTGAETRTFAWDGLDDAGRPVASGTYFYRLNVGEDRQTGRVLRVR
jgi:hypothetical protein